MPRLPHSLLQLASKKSPLLPLVLRGTRDLPSAINELRWLTEHVTATNPPCPRFARKRLLYLCKRRSRAEPLQYILGSQPFGELDIKCRPGVLIPRPETEAYTGHLAKLLINGELDEQFSLSSEEPVPPFPKAEWRGRSVEGKLRILDVCSGSGCISLLLHSLLSKSGRFPHIKTVGLDISPKAIALANENLFLAIQNKHIPSLHFQSQDLELARTLHPSSSPPAHLRGHKLLKFLASQKRKTEEKTQKLQLSGSNQPIHFAQHNIFSSLPKWAGDVDIIISNPPYISRSAFYTSTSRSVRKYEPRLALVPDRNDYGVDASNRISRFISRDGEESDIFYKRLLWLYKRGEASVLVMEVGDQEQALRVVGLALKKKQVAGRNRVEIWRDEPGVEAQDGEEQFVSVEGRVVPVRGAGKMRSVLLFRVSEMVERKKEGVGEKRVKNGKGKVWNKELECWEEKNKRVAGM
ncbi:S-adenosyl-L-methionine-dependent methyltransferase [Hyaloscypha variabilis]